MNTRPGGQCANDLAPWKTLATTRILDASPWFSVLRDEVELPSGRIVDDYYRIAAPDYVVVCAVRDDGRVVLERHYKQCLGRFILTSPAGSIDEAESPLQAAQRELREETGYEAADWTALGAYMVDGTRGICRAHLFLARGLTAVAEPLTSDMEDFRVELLEASEIAAAVRGGTICLLPDIALLSLALGNSPPMSVAPK